MQSAISTRDQISRACRGVGRGASCSMNRISYSGYRFPPEIIRRAVWLYFRLNLSFRDVEDLLAERGSKFELMRKLLKMQGFAPSHLVTVHLKSYPAAFQEIGLTAVHNRGKRMNNRAESPVRRRKRKVQGFSSAKSAQMFLSAHGPIYNTFNTCRHLIPAANHRTFPLSAN